MYPTLPRWSDAAAGAAPTAPRTSKPGVVPRHSLQHGAEVTPQEIILPAPSTRLSSLPAVAAATATTTTTVTATGTAATQQAKRAGRSGVLFVNHNVSPSDATAATSPHVSAPSPSSSPALPPAGAVSPAAAAPHRGGGGSRAAGHSRQLMRGGGGALPEGLHGAGPSYTTNRHGLVRGSTVANAVDALHGEEEPLSLGVEGVQTGEGVVVEVAAAPHRRSLTNSSGATACSNPQDHLLVSQLKRQLEKVNASVKSLTAGSRRQKQDQDNQQARWELQRAESDARLRLVLTNAREREALLLQYAAEARKRCVAQVEGEKQARAAAVTAHNADKTRWDGEMASLRRALDAASASLAAHAAKDSTAAAHQAELAQMDAALAALHQSAAETQHELEAALATAQSALNKTTVELHESRQAVHQCNYLAQQCRLFIRQVCQPGFSVVKGSSLEPVEKDRPEPTGFVLVPLTVLLHGYTLLPEGDRQEVIDHYDKEAKALH